LDAVSHLGRKAGMAKAWYVVHTYAGYEEKARASIEDKLKAAALQDFVDEILIPTEEMVEVKGGKKRISTRKNFPSYLLIHMELNEETWHLIKNVPKVTGFLGDPTPLPEAEAVSVVMPTAPVKLMWSWPVALLVSPPVPAKAVVTVKLPLLVNVTAVTVILGMVMALVPPMAWLLVPKVCTPVPAVKVEPSWVRPPLKVTSSLLFQVPPGLIVTNPTKVLVPVVEVMVNVSLTEVAPFTRRVTAPTVRVPVVTVSVPPMVVFPRKLTPPAVLAMTMLLYVT